MFQDYQGHLTEVDPVAIDWNQVNAGNFTYRLRQDPCPWNSLGRIKFMFPNEHEVYLHDTPSQGYFERQSRTFSSGCIRIENPMDLAAYLLKSDTSWTRERLLAAVQKNTELTVWLPRPIPVHLMYLTTWVDEDISVQFRQDVYWRDRLLDYALRQPPPAEYEIKRRSSLKCTGSNNSP